LRRLQMLTEIGAENNTSTVIMLPSDILNLAQKLTEKLSQNGSIVNSPKG
ncbi:MAG: slipin family protein, partial [Microcystis sp.]